jgi:glycine oxidase
MPSEQELTSPADIAVVGGGVIGMSIALALADRGWDVVLIERDALGRGASWAGGGILSPLPPTHCPEPLRPLLDRSLALYPHWCERLASLSGIDPEYWRCGAVYLPQDGEPLELPGLAQVRNTRLMKALAASLQRQGVRVIAPASVKGWIAQEGRLCGVETDRGELRCDRAVLAAGAWSSGLQAAEVRPIKGQMLLYRMKPGALPRILIGDHAYVIPRRDGHVLVGSTLEDVGFDLAATDEAREYLIRQGALLWPVLAGAEPVAQWSGLRPRGTAEMPSIEAATSPAGLYVATGHFRIGITLAPGTAELISEMVEGPGSA